MINSLLSKTADWGDSGSGAVSATEVAWSLSPCDPGLKGQFPSLDHSFLPVDAVE